ncbi:MAG TPA: glycerophosphodiester phosphodiesterase family protein [Nitrospira sp.]|nr:glycerophosphodiester phosphodiesterase family protein [Nitrospira sp.]
MANESPNRKILRIGHRGACGHAPENTLASIEQAIALQCAFTEVDIQRTSDDELVLLHDNRVDRTTNGRGRVSELTLPDIRKLDAGGGQMVPTLEEALSAATGRIGLILELKTKGLAYDVCATVRASGFNRPVIYASFLQEELQDVRRIDLHADTLALFKWFPKGPVAAAVKLQATHVGLRFNTATRHRVNALHNAGLTVFVYTVNKPAEVNKMNLLGVDGLISDFPDRI